MKTKKTATPKAPKEKPISPTLQTRQRNAVVEATAHGHHFPRNGWHWQWQNTRAIECERCGQRVTIEATKPYRVAGPATHEKCPGVKFWDLPRYGALGHTAREDAVKYADDILRSEYWAHVVSLADELREAKKDGELTGDWSDRLHEMVDSSYYVIYTHANFQVLRYSENHDAGPDEFGGVESFTKDDGINWAALAFHALMTDVRGLLGFEMDESEDNEWQNEAIVDATLANEEAP